MARNVGPTPAQTEKLVGLMETRADLATGHARTANARTRVRNGWTEVARILNSEGSGCIKDWKQWAKYWKDKKSAVRRKANLAEAARQRTGGGVDMEVVELSELEQKILSIAGGLSFATGDRHLAINPFPEQVDSVPPPTDPEPTTDGSAQSQSILLQANLPGPSVQDIQGSTQWNETAAAVVGEGSSVPDLLESPREAEDIAEVEAGRILTEMSSRADLGVPNEENTEMENPPGSMVRQRQESGARRRILLATPSRRGHVSLRALRTPGATPQRRRDAQVSPRAARPGGPTFSAARRRLLRRSPPSQRRSEMATLTERFIAIEERRAEADLRIARAMEIYSEGHRTMAQTINQLANTISIVAHQIIEIIRH